MHSCVNHAGEDVDPHVASVYSFLFLYTRHFEAEISFIPVEEPEVVLQNRERCFNRWGEATAFLLSSPFVSLFSTYASSYPLSPPSLLSPFLHSRSLHEIISHHAHTLHVEPPCTRYPDSVTHRAHLLSLQVSQV